MLEQLFSSKTRVKLINFFINQSEQEFYVREIARITGEFLNSVRRELENLEEFGLLKVELKDRKKFFRVDQDFFLFPEIKSLFIKADVFLENDLIDQIKKIGKIEVLLFSGVLTGVESNTDLFVVGDDLKKENLKLLLDVFTKKLGKKVRYTLMAVHEYKYRKDISDTFVYDILLKKHITVINNLDG